MSSSHPLSVCVCYCMCVCVTVLPHSPCTRSSSKRSVTHHRLFLSEGKRYSQSPDKRSIQIRNILSLPPPALSLSLSTHTHITKISYKRMLIWYLLLFGLLFVEHLITGKTNQTLCADTGYWELGCGDNFPSATAMSERQGSFTSTTVSRSQLQSKTGER